MHGLDWAQEHFTTWAQGTGTITELMLRLILAAVAGGLVGLEREVRGRQAGFRTNLLVCVGSCLTMIVSLHFATHPWKSQSPNLGININIDPARVAYGVMSGVGFLGAGTILHTKGTVRGLTTAAALWCVAAIGLAAGFGMYILAALAVALVLMALWVLDLVEDVLPKVHYRTVTVRRRWESGCIKETVEFFKTTGLDVTDVNFERVGDLTRADISLKVAFTSSRQYYECEKQLEKSAVLEFLATREG